MPSLALGRVSLGPGCPSPQSVPTPLVYLAWLRKWPHHRKSQLQSKGRIEVSEVPLQRGGWGEDSVFSKNQPQFTMLVSFTTAHGADAAT